MLQMTFLVLIFTSWQEGDAKLGQIRNPESFCQGNVTAKAGMTAKLYCCLGVWNKGAEVSQ